MRAIVYAKYGPPSVLRLEEIAKPAPKENEVLVKIHAAALNPADWHFLRGDPVVMRMASGLFAPKRPVLGADIAGTVEAVGTGVTRFKPGDEVYGDLSGAGFGAFAEYVAVKHGALATKPAALSFEEAAVVPLAGVTALQGLRDKGAIKQGHKVLINGASGGVGSFAVQIAKSYGAGVTAVCSAKNADLVRSIGADHVIDYAREDFTDNAGAYDLILDMIATHSPAELKRALAPDGKVVVVGFGSMLKMLRVVLTGGRRVGSMMARANHKDLDALRELIDRGTIKPVIDRRHTLEQVPEAIAYLEEGHTRGKIVIAVANGAAA